MPRSRGERQEFMATDGFPPSSCTDGSSLPIIFSLIACPPPVSLTDRARSIPTAFGLIHGGIESPSPLHALCSLSALCPPPSALQPHRLSSRRFVPAMGPGRARPPREGEGMKIHRLGPRANRTLTPGPWGGYSRRLFYRRKGYEKNLSAAQEEAAAQARFSFAHGDGQRP